MNCAQAPQARHLISLFIVELSISKLPFKQLIEIYFQEEISNFIAFCTQSTYFVLQYWLNLTAKFNEQHNNQLNISYKFFPKVFYLVLTLSLFSKLTDLALSFDWRISMLVKMIPSVSSSVL